MCLVTNGYELDSSWKTSGRLFQVFCFVSDKIGKKLILASFLFQNSFDFVSLVVWKQFTHEQDPSI